MKKLLFVLGVILSLPSFSQYCMTYPIGLPQGVEEVKVPSDYMYGTNKYKVVMFEIKVQGRPRIKVPGNSLNQTFVKEYLLEVCPDGCFYMIDQISAVDEKNQRSGFGVEDYFLYIKYFKP